MAKIEMKDLWLVFYGIIIAFGLQVIYDEIEIFPTISSRFIVGLIAFIILSILAVISYRRLERK